MAAALSCPDAETLMVFVTAGLPAEEATALDRHLDRCSSCNELVAHLAKSPLLQPEVPGSGERARIATGEESTTHPESDGDVPPVVPRRRVRGDLVGRYVVLEELGHGGMGVVYAAYDPDLDRKVALKLLRPRLATDAAGRGRLLREARTLAALSHRNIVAVFDVGTAGEQVFLAMEFVDGQTLREWQLRASVSWRRVANAYLEAGHGLAAAHAQSITHRDFKPSNVLFAEDGRVVVVDFGLASERTAALDPGAPPSPVATRGDLTETNAVMGTPAYMAPEQRDRGETGPKSDQFSFCVALLEAVAGTRPEVIDGAGTDIEGRHFDGVPPELRGVLRRGLAADPTERFDSMEALLVDLHRAVRPRGRRFAWAGGSAALLVGGVAVWSVGSEADPCGLREDPIEPLWSAARKAAGREAFTASGLPFAEPTWAAVESRLDTWASEWTEARSAVCLSEDERLRDMQRTCLRFGRSRFGKLVDMLATPDTAQIGKAMSAADQLPAVSRCLNPLATDPLPSQDSERELALDVLDRVAGIAARTDAADRDGLEEAAREAAKLATRIGHAPTAAAAHYELGRVLLGGSDPEKAEEVFYEAVWAAEAGRDDVRAAQAWTELVWVQGYHQQNFAVALRSARHAQAALDRFGGDKIVRSSLGRNLAWVDLLRGEPGLAEQRLRALLKVEGLTLLQASTLRNALATSLMRQGQFDPALELLDESLAGLERALGPRHPDRIPVGSNRAAVLRDLGRYDESIAAYAALLSDAQLSLPADHIDLGKLRINFGTALMDAGRADEARREMEEAARVFEVIHGPDHPLVGRALGGVASIDFDQKKFGTALAGFERAIAVLTAALGSDNPELTMHVVNRGMVLSELGRFDEALVSLGEGRRLITAHYGPEHAHLVIIYSAMAWAHREGGDADAALETYELAAALARRIKAPSLGDALRGVGRVHQRRGEHALAQNAFSEAVSAEVALEGHDPVYEAESRALLAEALFARGDEHAAELEAKRALELYRGRDADGAQETQDWIDEHLGRGSPGG